MRDPVANNGGDLAIAPQTEYRLQLGIGWQDNTIAPLQQRAIVAYARAVMSEPLEANGGAVWRCEFERVEEAVPMRHPHHVDRAYDVWTIYVRDDATMERLLELRLDEIVRRIGIRYPYARGKYTVYTAEWRMPM